MTETIQNIPFSELRASPLNTRKMFNAEAIERLAESIAAQGIQQNLVARRARDMEAPTLDLYYHELVAGERRLRAFALLVERGDRAATDTLPVRIVECDDATLLELNLIENLQREDMHPLDEAEGYAALVAAGREIAAIAAMVPFTKRHVELRLQLAAKLGPEAKAAFRDGALSLAQARTLAAYAPAENQAEAVEMIAEDDEGYTAEDLRRVLTEDMIPAARAFFDPALYTGGRVQDPDDEEVYFTDVPAFARLQTQAVKAAEARLKEIYAWVEVQADGYFSSYAYQHSKNKKISGAVIFVNNRTREVTVYNDLLKPEHARATAKTTAKAKGKKSAPGVVSPDAYLPTRAGLAIAKDAKTQALRAAMIDTGARPAMTAVILALMDARGDIHLRRDFSTPADEAIVSPAVTAVLNKYRPRFKGGLAGARDGAEMEIAFGKSNGKVFDALSGFTDAEIEELFTALVASTVGTYPGYAAQLGDGEIAAGLARQCGADAARHWKIDAAYLETCRKLPLQRIAASIGVTRADACLSLDDAPLLPGDFTKLKAKDLRAAILAHLRHEPDAAVFLPAPFHFGTPAELLAMAGPQKAKPAEAAKTNGAAPAKKPRKAIKPNGDPLGGRAKIKSAAKTKEAKSKIAKKLAEAAANSVTRGVLA